MTDPTPADAELSFEAALTRLESLVQRLESGQAPLEEAVSMYEDGARLKALCEARLKEAQLRVEKVVLGADGRPTGTAPADFGQ